MAPNNNIENKPKTKKSSEEVIATDLSLSGSQISLASRASTSRELSNRGIFLPSTCSLLRQRPMSAVPELHAYKNKDEHSHRYKINVLRPQSADNFSPGKKNKGDIDFFECSRSKLNSSKILDKLIKEPVMRSWTTVRSDDASQTTTITDDSIYEDIDENKTDTEEHDEEEGIQSEISFGTKIQNLAQKNSSMSLEPGIKHKPPLPTNKRTEVIKLLSPKKSLEDLQKSPPPGVSMSKEYQEKYHSTNEWDNFNTTCLSIAKIDEEQCDEQINNSAPEFYDNGEEVDISKQKDICDTIGAPSVESKIDMFFQLSGGNDNKIKEIEIFEQETDYLFKKLRSHQKAFTEYYEVSKKLPEIIENGVVSNSQTTIKPESNTSGSETEINNTDFKQFELSHTVMEEIKNLIKREFIGLGNNAAIRLLSQCSEEKGDDNSNPSNHIENNENCKFSFDKYDEGLKKDNEFLSNGNSDPDANKSNGDNLNTGKDRKLSMLLGDSNELSELSVRPEREFTMKKKKAETVQNVLSTLPTTYNDITTILQFLENDTSKFDKSQKDINKWLPPAKQVINNNECNKIIDVPIKELACNNIKVTPSKNYNEILTFLDEVDQSCSVILNAAKIRAYSVQRSTEKLLNGAMPSMEALLQMSRVDLAQKVIGMYLQLEEKTSSVQLLQETLNDQRQATQKMMKNSETESLKKIKSQKNEYESVIKRHQKFIDQLINEKKSLTEQCENLIKQLKQQDERHSSAMKAAEHRFNVELQATKERQVIGEKLRREKWLIGKTEKIKEMTVKGLEPELHNMKVRHDQEISDIRTLHKQEIEELELRASRRTHQQCETLREQLNAERDEMLLKEREALNQKISKTIENEEKNYQEERRRLISEHERLKQRLTEEYNAKSKEFDSRLETALKEKDRLIENIKSEFEDRIDTLIRKQKNEIKSMKENYEIEQERWKSNLKKDEDAWKLNKEKEILALCKKERDREIEIVIERLENESIELKTQIETTAENRIKRLNEKYTNEIKYLEEAEKQAQIRYLDVKNQLVNSENDLIYLRGVIKKMEKKLEDLAEENSQLLQERGRVQEIIRQELESEMKSLQTQLINLRSEREREMEEVYDRVKSAITKKDETISKMRQEYTLLEDKCAHLDELLKNQRKTYLLEAN